MNGLKERKTESEPIILVTEANTKDNGSMTIKMEQVYLYTQMRIGTKENLEKEKKVEKEFIYM